MTSGKEAKARIRINALLTEAGWRLVETAEGRENVRLEDTVDLTKIGDDFEGTEHGFIDYLLTDENHYPLCVLEAKRESLHPLSAKEQARDYAAGKKCRFVILSNGLAHYLWDTKTGNPEVISKFPSQQSLIALGEYQPQPQALAAADIAADYAGSNKKLRDYQIGAIEAVQQAAKSGKKRYLLEMATGTGKTTVAGALCKLFLATGNARRILFLVDRIELENQAATALTDLFKNQYFVRKYKDGDWHDGQIVISTVQTLMFADKYRREFFPTDFDLVISDEAHRSIGGNARAVFEYFHGYKLGLTATPKDYLKGIDRQKLEQNNPKALEQRNLNDTYKTFGCEQGEPTFRYDLQRGIGDEVLIKPYIIDARTTITTQLLSTTGYALLTEDEDGRESETFYGARAFENSFFNENTNRVLCEAILAHGLCDPHTGEFGKTLVFCVSRAHAAKIADQLNRLAMEKWHGKYQSDFAMQITSDVEGAAGHSKNFANNRLRGKSVFADATHPDYDTSKTRVCVTVGMMTTGYDCPDLLNIVLLRPVFSPTDFIQMRGRGTRPHPFVYGETGERKNKTQFLLLDCFGICAYFENDFDYDRHIDLPVAASGNTPQGAYPVPPKPVPLSPGIVDETPDALATVAVIHTDDGTMEIDRRLYPTPHQQFEHLLQENATLQKIRREHGIVGLETYIMQKIFNKPEEFWSAEKLCESYRRADPGIDRNLTLKEMILKAINELFRFKSSEERLDEEFQKFLTIHQPQSESAGILRLLRDFFQLYLSHAAFRDIINSKKYSELSGYQIFSLKDLEKLNVGIPGIIRTVQTYADEHLQKEMAEFTWNEAA